MNKNNILSFEEWLYYEWDIEPSEYKHYDKHHKSSLRNEYNEYVAECAASK